MTAIVSFNKHFLRLIDAGQLCASCNDIAKVDDCHRFVRCENDEVGVMNQTKKSMNNPFYRRRDTVRQIKFLPCLRVSDKLILLTYII